MALITPVGNPNHQHNENVIVNLVDYPVITHTDAVGVSRFHLLASMRTGVAGELENLFQYTNLNAIR